MTLTRELRRGTLELLLLRLLSEEPMYGYRLISELEERSEGELPVNEGTLYPILYRLEDQGYITPTWRQRERGVPRKYYQVTEEGHRCLEELEAEWRSFSTTVNRVLATDPTPSGAETADRDEEEER